MEKTYTLFLKALKASLLNSSVNWDDSNTISDADWHNLFWLANFQNVLPMKYEAVYKCPAAQAADASLMATIKQKITLTVVSQTIRTEEAVRLLKILEKKNLHPLVVKGLVCRNLYPKPDFRISGAEDILIPWEEYKPCHEALLEFGMELVNPGQNVEKAAEVSYKGKNSSFYIELHKNLFPPESSAYGDLNRFFENVERRAIHISAVEGSTLIPTLNFTDHLFYLICHSFKHFLHSGFGIRQVCDVVLFANAYGKCVDWTYILNSCREIKAEKFAACMFLIGNKYLTFDPEKAGYPDSWRKIQINEEMMLQDLLAGGIFGDSSLSRLHSSTMTLEAVVADKHGTKFHYGILKSLFPSAKALMGRYPYLEKNPWMLPAAWVQRIHGYIKESRHSYNDRASESVKIGEARIKLFKEYGIIDK